MSLDLRVRLLFVVLALAAAPGCTATQLRRHTIRQASTIHDIYQQQVLDNLAMFVHNRGSYPYFSLIGQGTSSLTDSATLADTNGWARNAAGSLIYSTAGLNPSLMRQQQGTWQTYPINDSVKLTIMRCVYHAAMDGNLGPIGESCPDCSNLYYAYYNIEPPFPTDTIPYHNGPSNNPADPANTKYAVGKLVNPAPEGSMAIDTDISFTKKDEYKGYTLFLPPNQAIVVAGSSGGTSATDQKVTLQLATPLQAAVPVPTAFTLALRTRPPIRGIVTPECLNFSQNWFCHGPKLPKHFDKCTPYGYYCGTYVWVPEGGIDQLTKLTLLIQDIAYYDPPQAGTQTVTTQKSKDAPGLKAGKSPAAVRSMSRDILDSKVFTPEQKLQLQEKLIESLPEVDQSSGLDETTTTTISTPSFRQPTRFPSGILNLQQDLNLLPPQPR